MPAHEHTEGWTPRPFTRVRYFSGQMLSADDLTAEQEYSIRKRELHNRALHGSGVVHGLDVTGGSDAVMVSPGVALDGLGREIVVPQAVSVDVTVGAGEVVLRYAEDAAALTPGGEPSRTVETYELRVEAPTDPPEDDGVVLAVVERSEAGVDVRHHPHRNAVTTPRLLELIRDLRERVASLEARLAGHEARQP
jgi:hypothetical protein